MCPNLNLADTDAIGYVKMSNNQIVGEIKYNIYGHGTGKNLNHFH